MAITRTDIKSLVDASTGRATEKAPLIELKCNEALRLAIMKHPFRQSCSYPTDIAITENATSVDISAITGLRHIISAAIVTTDDTSFAPIELTNEVWWARNVTDSTGQQQGWPAACRRDGTNLLLDRPAEADLQLRLRVSTDQTFATDATECPITVLSEFVEQYVTAFVFLSIENEARYRTWLELAMGSQYLMNGKIGGSLKSAIDIDQREWGEELRASRYSGPSGSGGLAVKNLITGHDDYGNIRLWS
jgi:hypothetical protein